MPQFHSSESLEDKVPLFLFVNPVYTGGQVKRYRRIFEPVFFDDFDQISVEALGIQTKVIPHFKALICGSLEPKKLRIWLQNKASTPS